MSQNLRSLVAANVVPISLDPRNRGKAMHLLPVHGEDVKTPSRALLDFKGGKAEFVLRSRHGELTSG
jgi:hypothetical protein